MKPSKLIPNQYRLPGGAVVAAFGSLCAIGLWLFTPNMVMAQSFVQRDQEALTIITQTITAGGGQQVLDSVQDFTETGTVTYNFTNPVTGSVTVKSRGLHQLKIEADLPTGRRTTIVNGEGGSLKEADGRNWPIYRQNAAGLGSLTLPYLPLIGAEKDASVSIIYGGLITHNGASAYDVRLQRVYTKQQDPSGNRGVREARDFYIDSKTFLVSAVSDRIHFGMGPKDEGVLHEMLYTNYQTENGIATPLTITETIRGVDSFTMNFSQVSFNSGLSNDEFAQ